VLPAFGSGVFYLSLAYVSPNQYDSGFFYARLKNRELNQYPWIGAQCNWRSATDSQSNLIIGCEQQPIEIKNY